jgi:transposase
MPKLMFARAAQGAVEAEQIRKLAVSRHAPADWILRAKMVRRSWDGLRTAEIARELGCHPRTVRERIGRFNEEGVDGFADRPGKGRKRRLSETERGTIIALVASEPPGRLVRRADGELAAADEQAVAHWTLDALAEAARERGIRVGRSQVRRILVAEKVRWRNTRSWAESADPEFVPKGQRSSPATPTRPRGRRPSASMSSVR